MFCFSDWLLRKRPCTLHLRYMKSKSYNLGSGGIQAFHQTISQTFLRPANRRALPFICRPTPT